MKRAATILAVLAILGGCGEQNASMTQIKAGPFSIKDTKDNDVTLKGSYNPDTGAIVVENFTLRNNASDPNQTLPAIIGANMLYQRQLGENAVGIIDAGGRIVSTVAPILGQRIQAKRDVEMAELTSRQAIVEAVAGVATGQWKPQTIERYLSDEERAEFRRQIAELQRKLNAQTPPTSQPAEPSHEEVGYRDDELEPEFLRTVRL